MTDLSVTILTEKPEDAPAIERLHERTFGPGRFVPFRDRGIGKAMMERALKDAKEKGHKLVLLVGDAPYYARVGFKRVPNGAIKMPGPADPARILAAELVEGALAGVTGEVRPDWDSQKDSQ